MKHQQPRVRMAGTVVLLAILALLAAGCAQVDRIATAVEDDIAYERGNQAMYADNLPEAVAQYRLAAAAGHAKAQYRLSLLAATGSGMQADGAEALKWMQASAQAGHAPAQLMLGTWLLSGSLAPYNPGQAARWFQRAADQGDSAAMYTLGVLYARGEGVTRDPQAALGWFRRAAQNGFDVPPALTTAAGVAALGDNAETARRPAAANPVGQRALVAEIQSGLAELGYDPGPADGMMGKRTAAAIAAFQRDAGLAVDGQPSAELAGLIRARLKR